MKKLITISLLILAACGPSREEWEAREKQKQDSANEAIALEAAASGIPPEQIPQSNKYCDINYFNITVYYFNGCEYICFKDANDLKNFSVTHLGNCNNPIHQTKEITNE